MAHHDLKILKQFFEAADSMEKPFELREMDRNFQVGDTITQHEWMIPGHYYTGRKTTPRTITYILTHDQISGLKDGYGILGLAVTENQEDTV